MKGDQEAKRFLKALPSFRPGFDSRSRHLGVYAASMALANSFAIKEASIKARRAGAEIPAIYELVLQSYLFLGFPRMLTAAECFRETFPDFKAPAGSGIGPKQFSVWKRRGEELCRKVYAVNFEKLENKLRSFSPEILEWTILEGYGKVLSRPRLDIKDRELATVAMLMADNRPKQLFSHIRGALNVGVSRKLLAAVIKDLGKVTDADSKMALAFLKKTEN